MLIKRFQFLVVLFLSLNAMSLRADLESSGEQAPWSGMSVGFDVGSIAGHLLQGLRVGSPSFFNGYARVAASGYLGWVQNVMSITDSTYSWLPYGLFKLGIHAGSFVYGLPIRVASYANIDMVVPSLKISNKSVIFGLDGGVDGEIFLDPPRKHAMFFTLGGIGLFAPTADHLKGKPSFANGFSTSFGYRYYF